MYEKLQQRVLAADDHPVNRMVMGLLLKNLGMESDLVENGKQAVEAAAHHDYGMILMDIMMPEMDGFEASFEIRKREFDLEIHTPIIAVTALNKEDVKVRAVASGMDDYVAKPISRDILQAKIEHWIQIPVHRQPLTREMVDKVKALSGQDAED